MATNKTNTDKATAIYHSVRKCEGFEKTAKILWNLVQQAQRRTPNKERLLYLDIDGHRNAEGGFDHDMLELQEKFIPEMLMPYLTRATVPLYEMANQKPQDNDIPESLLIAPVGCKPLA